MKTANGDFLKFNREINSLEDNVKLIYDMKKVAIAEMENLKLIIRYGSAGKLKSVLAKDTIVASFDRDISSIQNKHDALYQDLQTLKTYIENNLGVVEKTEMIMNILNYKMYEIQYDFRTKIKELQEKRKSCVTENQHDAELALQLVEIDKNISECEEEHSKEVQSLKEQKLEAQREYENTISILDTYLENITTVYEQLLRLIEAEKAALSESNVELINERVNEQFEPIRTELERYTELQATGWKALYPEEKISAILESRGLKITKSGILVTASGLRITYQEAKEAKLLDDINASWSEIFFQKHDVSDEDTVSKPSSKSKMEEYEKMSSEDVLYLQEQLGKPLTLALAEVTSRKPSDPIHYLAHWLFKYRYNQQAEYLNSLEVDALNEERARLAKERWHKMLEEEARNVVMEMIIRAEQQAMLNELRRIQAELEATEEEEENFDDEARDTLGIYDGPVSGQKF